jgi:hypothetical protein
MLWPDVMPLTAAMTSGTVLSINATSSNVSELL